jgi:hypothetical protein
MDSLTVASVAFEENFTDRFRKELPDHVRNE